MSRTDRVRQPGERQGAHKGGQRVSCEIFVGFATRDLKATGRCPVYLEEETVSSRWGLEVLGTRVRQKGGHRREVNSGRAKKECKCHRGWRQRSCERRDSSRVGTEASSNDELLDSAQVA